MENESIYIIIFKLLSYLSILMGEMEIIPKRTLGINIIINSHIVIYPDK